MERSGALGHDQAQALLEDHDRLAVMRRWTDAALVGAVVPELEEYRQIARLLGAAARWRERAAA